MEKKQTYSSDQITVIVFKDHLTSRSFQFPMKWISRLGLVIGIITFFSVFGSALAIKYYRIASSSHSSNLHELELEIDDLKAQLKKWESHSIGSSVQSTASSSTGDSTPSSNHVTNPTLKNGPLLYSLFPTQTQFLQSPQQDFPLQIQNPKFKWVNQTLSVEFALEYKKNDSGNQQGRIVLLAHGKNTLMSYPEETLNLVTQDEPNPTLIHPERGESYSVSHYRLVSATFAPLGSKKALQTLEVFLFNREGNQLLFHHSYPISRQEQHATSQTEETQP